MTIPTWGYDTSIQSPRLQYMLNLQVVSECQDGPSDSPVDPENPASKIKTISLGFLKTFIVCHRMGTYPYPLVGD
jgi:hypothetical protein